MSLSIPNEMASISTSISSLFVNTLLIMKVTTKPLSLIIFYFPINVDQTLKIDWFLSELQAFKLKDENNAI